MSLSSIYQELHRNALRSGEDRALTLRGGARIAVRSVDGITTLTISRPKKPLGSTEIETFKRDFAIPASAIRFPLDEQGTRIGMGDVPWFYIAYRWREEG